MREARFVLCQGATPDPGPALWAARRAGLLAEVAALEAALTAPPAALPGEATAEDLEPV